MTFSGTEWPSCTAWSRLSISWFHTWLDLPEWCILLVWSFVRMHHKKPMCRLLTLQIVLGSLLGHNTGLSPAYNKNFEFPPFQECRRRCGCSNCLSLERGLPVRVGEQVLGSCSQQGDETQLNSRPDDGAVIHAITTFGEVFFKLSHCNPSLSNSLIDCTTRWTATHQTQTKQRAPSATLFAPSAGLSCFFWTSSKTIFRLKSQFTGNTRSTKRTMLQEYQESW